MLGLCMQINWVNAGRMERLTLCRRGAVRHAGAHAQAVWEHFMQGLEIPKQWVAFVTDRYHSMLLILRRLSQLTGPYAKQQQRLLVAMHRVICATGAKAIDPKDSGTWQLFLCHIHLPFTVPQLHELSL